MKAETLVNFRVAQLALIGASRNREIDRFIFNNLQSVSYGDNMTIVEVSLEKDLVVVEVNDTDVQSYLPINCMSDEVAEEMHALQQVKKEHLNFVNQENLVSNVNLV
jgi:hypothetical protein